MEVLPTFSVSGQLSLDTTDKPLDGSDLKPMESITEIVEPVEVSATMGSGTTDKDTAALNQPDATTPRGEDYVKHLEERVKLLEEQCRNIENAKETEGTPHGNASEQNKKELTINIIDADVDDDKWKDTENEARGAINDGSKTDTPAGLLPMIPKVRRLGFADFKNRYGDEDCRYAVEVLMAGTDLLEEIQHEQILRLPKSEKQSQKISLSVEPKSKNEHTGQAEIRWPERVRIQSQHILDRLGKVTGSNFATESKTFFRPFQLLIHAQDKMKEALKELESKWAGSENPGTTVSQETFAHQADASVKTEDGEVPSISTKAEKALDIEKIPERSTESSESPDKEAESESPTQGMSEEGPDSLIDSVDAWRDMRCYVNFVDELMPLFHQFDHLDHTSCAKVRFDDLWYLFRTGELVYTPTAYDTSGSDGPNPPLSSAYQSIWRAYTVRTPWARYKVDSLDATDKLSDREADSIPDSEIFALFGFYIDYDGQSFGTVKKKFTIRYFEGEQDVKSLPIYPLRFVDNYENLKKTLKDTGEKFKKCVESKHFSYSGWTITCDPQGEQISDSKNEVIKYPDHIDSDVIADFLEAFQTCPHWKPKHHFPEEETARFIQKNDPLPIMQWSGRDRKNLVSRADDVVQADNPVDMLMRNAYLLKDEFLLGCKKRKEQVKKEAQMLGDEDLMLLPRRVFAYILRERKFAQVDICSLRPITKQGSGFEKLKLRKGQSELVQALVDSHFTKKRVEKLHYGGNLDQDVVQGKGRGLIILLHGVPGVGKTSTAECVARANDKPLFVITCGDLGFTPAEVEASLSEIFRLAHLWDCVLLLDEADIFLEERGKFDLKRNALVSVFLRILEYYNGILFLTTNRVGTFDEAFKSRIHMSLHYPDLEEQQTLLIWEMNLARTKEIDQERTRATGEPLLNVHETEILLFAQKHFWKTSPGHGRWNGRQIRNAFQIASSLARYELQTEQTEHMKIQSPENLAPIKIKPELKAEHFKSVALATLEFDRYMKATRGKTDADLARDHGVRADDFNAAIKDVKSASQMLPGPRALHSSQYTEDELNSIKREGTAGQNFSSPNNYHDSPHNPHQNSPSPNYQHRRAIDHVEEGIRVTPNVDRYDDATPWGRNASPNLFNENPHTIQHTQASAIGTTGYLNKQPSIFD